MLPAPSTHPGRHPFKVAPALQHLAGSLAQDWCPQKRITAPSHLAGSPGGNWNTFKATPVLGRGRASLTHQPTHSSYCQAFQSAALGPALPINASAVVAGWSLQPAGLRTGPPTSSPRSWPSYHRKVHTAHTLDTLGVPGSVDRVGGRVVLRGTTKPFLHKATNFRTRRHG